MSLATLRDVLEPARTGGYAVAGLVVLGWEDARAYVDAAVAENAPVILQAGPGCRAHTPLPVLAAMFQNLAQSAPVPVVAHLAHGQSIAECRAALDAGFSSIMYDGSRLSLEDNIAATRAVVDLGHAAGVSVEGEIGFVGYARGEVSQSTGADEAERFAAETGVDAMAVSVGNTHLMERVGAEIDFPAVAAIEARTEIPLVIHGGSGIPVAVRQRLSRETAVSKFNIGTELRQTFGSALKQGLAARPDRFDRIAILKETVAPLRDAARTIISALYRP